eukprot:scaffold17319_cov99-Phaeocystis_antarctica.AAC.3
MSFRSQHTRPAVAVTEVQAPALAGMQAHHFWRKGDSMLDVDAGSGEMTLYLQAKYGLLCRGVDIVKPSNNVFFAKKASLYGR